MAQKVEYRTIRTHVLQHWGFVLAVLKASYKFAVQKNIMCLYRVIKASPLYPSLSHWIIKLTLTLNPHFLSFFYSGPFDALHSDSNQKSQRKVVGRPVTWQ